MKFFEGEGKRIVLSIFLLVALVTYGQEDLDEVFEDAKNPVSFRIGTNIVRIIYGTPNISGEIQFKEKIGVDLELGAPLFGYKERYVLFEKQVINGFEMNIGAGGYIPLYMYTNSTIYLGAEYQMWNYNSSNQEIAKWHEIVNVNSSFTGDYMYSLDPGGVLRFKRKENRIGVKFGVNFDISTKLALLYGLHFSYSVQKIKFDEAKSIGVNWLNDVPQDWITGFFGTSAYVRASLTLKYRI